MLGDSPERVPDQRTRHGNSPSAKRVESVAQHVEKMVADGIILKKLTTEFVKYNSLECEPMPNVMVTLSNIGGALCSMLQSLADAHYLTAVQ